MDEQPATITPKEEKHSINWGWIVWPCVILILYVLSSGPLIMLSQKELIPQDNGFLTKFYSPLRWAYNETPMHKPLGMYFHLWAPKFIDKNGDFQK